MKPFYKSSNKSNRFHLKMESNVETATAIVALLLVKINKKKRKRSEKKSYSSFLIFKSLKKFIQVFFLRVYTNISTAKAASIHLCLSICGRRSFFFPIDTI